MNSKASDAKIYQIRVEGHLDTRWSDWLSPMTIEMDNRAEGDPITILTGPMTDQAALRGTLSKLWDLNLTVLSVTQLDDAPDR
jgi:hypothetical protein